MADGLSQKGVVKNLQAMLSSGKKLEKGSSEMRRVVDKGAKDTSKTWPQTERAARAKQKGGMKTA